MARSVALLMLAAHACGQVPPAWQEAPIAGPAPPVASSSTLERTGEVRTRIPVSIPPASLTGKVLLDGSPPPAASVLVQGICNGSVVRETYSSDRGRFTLQLPAMRRTNSPGRFDAPGLDGCELRLSSPGYQSESIDLANRRVMDNPEVGSFSLRRVGSAEGTLVSFTSLKAPKDAHNAYRKAVHQMEKSKWADARRNLDKALRSYPEYAAAWCELGIVEQHDNRPEQARAAWRKAVALDPKFIRPHLKLADAALREKHWKELAEATGHIIMLDPAASPQTYLYNALAEFSLRRFDEAERSARQAIRLDPDHRFPKAEHLLGVILANKEDKAGAIQHMRAYLALLPNAPDAVYVRRQIAELEKTQR